MKRRRWAVGLAGLAVIAAAALWVFGQRPPLAEVAARVRPGMTPAEVEAVIGRPPDQTRSHLEPVEGSVAAGRGWVLRTVSYGYWESSDQALFVYYSDGRADSVELVWIHPTPILDRLYDRARTWLGL